MATPKLTSARYNNIFPMIPIDNLSMVDVFIILLSRKYGKLASVVNKRLVYRYVVKTLDNAESVKLQYRSLAKVMDDPSKPAASSKMPPNWL